VSAGFPGGIDTADQKEWSTVNMMFDVLIRLGCILFAITTAVMLRREWRRHRRRHPRFPIPKVCLQDVDERFRIDSVERAREGVVAFISNSDNHLPATPSDLETYVLTLLAKRASHLFEFGTCSGRTTYLWALNSPVDARITTLTLPPDDVQMELSPEMQGNDIQHAISESSFDRFVYSDTSVEAKIEQLFQDSATLDTGPYQGKMDLIFVDGGHSYAYVKNDSDKALEMVAPGGMIIWHDYRGRRCKETEGVYRYLNELSGTYPLQLVDGTSLVVYRHPSDRTVVLPTTSGQAA
jgi:hypothetical protein